jgi:hypothetical protein
MISFDKTNSGANSKVLVTLLLDIGTFVERLWNVCSFTVLTLLLLNSLLTFYPICRAGRCLTARWWTPCGSAPPAWRRVRRRRRRIPPFSTPSRSPALASSSSRPPLSEGDSIYRYLLSLRIGGCGKCCGSGSAGSACL